MRALCADIAARMPALAHVDVSRMAITWARARKPVRHGLQASLTPLRFAGGKLVDERQGRRWTIQRVYDATGREMLYILAFYLPRFLELPFDEKLITVFHELWHVGPDFDGDIRRHAGRCYAHSGSQRGYDDAMRVLANEYLTLDPPEESIAFLRLSYHELCQQYGGVVGQQISRPKLVPC